MKSHSETGSGKGATTLPAVVDMRATDDPLRVLVIDDERFHAEAVAESLDRVGYSCVIATSGSAGARKIEQEDFDVVLTDLRMSDMDGLAILRKAKHDLPDAEVVVITGHGDVKTAVEAIKQGAANYLTKPVDLAELRAIVDRAAERLRLARANRDLKRQLDEKFGFEGVIGNSPRMHEVLAKLKQVAPTSATTLIVGETGTGKELAARAIHYNSPRKEKPFVAMNCTALNENLLDDELFGHEPGSFTGADRVRKGRFEAANGGTLFLDEIGDMPLTLQAKLLRVLENGEVFRIGSNTPIKVNVRLISATNRDLEAAVEAGTFRKDLYYRLKIVTVKLPPLRDRREDIPLLTAHFLKEFNTRHDKNVQRVSDPVRKAMAAYDWPGNVRELRNLVESMVVTDSDGVLDMDDVPEGESLRRVQGSDGPASGPSALAGRPLTEVERYYCERALELTQGKREEAARMLGIGERTLYRMMQDWKVQDQIRQVLGETSGNVEEAAKKLDMAPAALERKLKKLGVRDEEYRRGIGFMPRIQQLSPSVVTKIAAGEVIERPCSVVKELLENSVDAGANRIDVDVDAGGVECIRVVDNGCGISADELPLAFASHATSKLQTADDLFQIATLGFRGEALASIGGVAQVTLQSRVPGTPHGAEMTCHGGDLSAARAWNGAAGTRIEVRHLFYNTPVRRKFLRTTGTEMGHLCEMFTRLSLSHPTVHWVLRHNGKLVYEVPSTAGLADRIGLFFGAEVRDQLYEIEVRHGPIHLHGFITDPACERGNAKMQYLFVNGRWVRDRSLAHALQEGYRGLLMTGRYAVAFLFLDLPPDQVDVNVHPTKSEVRFRDGNALHHLVFAAVRERLRAENLTPRLQVTSGIAAPPAPAERTIWAAPPEAAPMTRLPDPPAIGPVGNALRGVPPADTLPPGERPPPIESVAAEAERHGGRSLQKAIQLYDCYLVLETPEGMLVIDQHALHERILFEQLKRRLRSGALETQRLLIPEPIELTADQAARTLDQRAALAELGLGVEDFGGGTVLLTSYPAILGRRPTREVFKAVVDHLMAKDRPPTREVLLNDLLSLMACHSAVRAGDRLAPEEIAALLEQRQLADDTHHCPHGRPTALLFSRHDLEKQFRRV